MGRCLFLASALGAACLLGCAGDSAPGYGPGNQFLDRDCDPGLDVCDVNDPECQQDVWVATACQRSQKAGDLPPIRSITSEEFGEELQQDVTPDRPPSSWDITLGLLGLLDMSSNPDGDTVDALVEGVLGFYDSRTGVVTLLSDATGLSAESKVLVLSHEFVHVLQDRSAGFDLLGSATTTDLLVANDALTEGEATVHSNIALAVGNGNEADDLDWDGYLDSLFGNVHGAIDNSNSPLVAALLQLPYPLGSGPVLDAWRDDAQRSINRLYTSDRIFSVVDWFRDYPDGFESPRPQLDCPSPAPPTGYELTGRDVLGVTGVAALWSAQNSTADAGFEQGRAWRGGLTWVYSKGDDPEARPEGSVLVWQTRWSSTERAGAVEALLAESDLFVRVRDQQALIVASDDPDALAWAEAGFEAWLDCDATKRKSLSEPWLPYRRPEPRHYFPHGQPLERP